MRRSRQALTDNEAQEILETGITGILGVQGDDDYPYTIPINYVYLNKKIYMHCATSGHKIDAIKKNEKVSFCVIAKDTVVPEKFTTFYRSAIAFGRAQLLSEGNEYDDAIYALSKKYSPNETEDCIENEIKSSLGRFLIIAIDIEHLTGKEAIELVRKREENKE